MFIRPGDILLYRESSQLFDRLVQLAEKVEDGRQKYEFFHCAIALNQWDKLEAVGRCVSINPIEQSGFQVFRPPISEQNVYYALNEVQQFIGQKYDWMLIVDDAVRYFTHNLVHLPVRYIRSRERHAKICSSLVARYLGYAGWTPYYGFNVSPEDVWIVVKDYEVEGE